jgi:hypothetical protein
MFLKLFFILNSESSLSSVFCLLPSDLLFLISEFLLFSFVALHLSRALYKFNLFMQNKPNFRKRKMNISNYIKKTYENQTLSRSGKNKPNQSQFQNSAQAVGISNIEQEMLKLIILCGQIIYHFIVMLSIAWMYCPELSRPIRYNSNKPFWLMICARELLSKNAL